MSEILNNYVSSRQQANIHSSNHQLIILGNGFDLECGLHSRFADFMEYRPWMMMREALRNAALTKSTIAESISKIDYDELDSAMEQLQQALDKLYNVRNKVIDAEYKVNEAYDRYIADSGNITFDESQSTDFGEATRTLQKIRDQDQEGKTNCQVKKSSEKLLNIFDTLATNNNCLRSVRDELKAAYTELFGQSSENLDPIAYYHAGKTVWDIILQENSQKTWYNIEAEIKNWMTLSEKFTSAPYSKVADKINAEIIPTDKYLPIITKPSSSGLPIAQVAYFLHSLSRSQHKWTPKDISSLLMQELHRFESAFCQYLNSEIRNHENHYKKCAKELLSKIIQFGLPNNYKTNVSILDFNFTDPLDKNNKINIPNNIEVDPVVVNIHGSCKNSTAIFGIDGTDNMKEENSRHFTKTYRLLSLNNPNIRSIIHIQHENRNDNSLPDMIKFYGHSLSEADYSYFQSIFDGINLYEGNTRLIFFYRPRRDNTTAEGARISNSDAANEMKDKVTKLLLTYGDTLTNKDHGKNLIHKLILEGRLNVLPI